jgi:methionyl-tRNA formyltransferase
MTSPKIAFAGDREIAVDVLRFLADTPAEVSALLLPEKGDATHDTEIRSLCSGIPDEYVMRGDEFKKQENIELLTSLAPDYLLSVHFQHIFPETVLEIPTHDPINLHPAYLPYNRGWHTPSWALWEQTPYGATLHVMDESVDSGEIIAQRKVHPRPEDTANTLYQRALDAEIELFKNTWPSLADFSYDTSPQSEADATVHTKSDLEQIRPIDLEESVVARDLLRKLRALTTNDISEAAYFERGGDRYRVQVTVTPEKDRD